MPSLATVARYRVGIIAALGTIFGAATAFGSDLNVFDPTLLSAAGEQLLSADWANTFSDPNVQVGPLQLAIFGASSLLAQAAQVPLSVPLSLLAQTTVPLGLLFVVRRANAEDATSSPGAELVAGMGAIVFGVGWTAYQTAQPADAIVPLLWVLAAIEARAGRSAVAGGVLAAAGALKLWGLLGVPLLLLNRDLRGVGEGAAAATTITAILWAPFFLFGTVRTFGFRWPLWSDALLGFLDPDSLFFTWPMRLVQAAVVLAFGTAVVLLLLRRTIAIWTAPLAIAAAKIALDPSFWYWYWLPIDVLALVALGTVRSWSRSPYTRWAVAAATAILLFLPPLGGRGAAVIAAGMLLTAGAIHAHSRKPRPPPGSRRDPSSARGGGRRS